MTFRSTLSALGLSATAALVAALFVMPPIGPADAADSVVRCQGYQRMTILLRTTNAAERFSMRDCVSAVRPAVVKHPASIGVGRKDIRV